MTKIVKEQNIIAFFLTCLGLYVIYASLLMSIWHASNPEEGFLPFALGSILVILSITFLISGIKKDEKREFNTNRKRLICYVVVTSFYLVTFIQLGFLLSTGISLTIIMRWIERERWRTTLLVAVGSSFFCLFLFRYLLGITLPLGPLDRWSYIFVRG